MGKSINYELLIKIFVFDGTLNKDLFIKSKCVVLVFDFFIRRKSDGHNLNVDFINIYSKFI